MVDQMQIGENEIMHEVVCNLCGSKDLSIDMDFGKVKIFKCQRCELLQVLPQQDHQIAELQREYSNIQKNSNTGKKRLGWIEKYSPDRGKILDVECGKGFFLNFAREKGWDTYGVTASREMLKLAKDKLNLAVSEGTINDLPYPPGFFDCITMWNEIDYSKNPMNELMQANRLLRINGVLAIMALNSGSFFPRFFWKKRFLEKEKNRNFFLSPEILGKMLELNGFEVLKEKTISGLAKLSLIPFKREWANNFVVFARKKEEIEHKIQWYTS